MQEMKCFEWQVFSGDSRVADRFRKSVNKLTWNIECGCTVSYPQPSTSPLADVQSNAFLQPIMQSHELKSK